LNSSTTRLNCSSANAISRISSEVVVQYNNNLKDYN
jgi:hypothetical protein